MGWSNSAMVKRYAHVTTRLRRDIADRLNSSLLGQQTTGVARRSPDGGQFELAVYSEDVPALVELEVAVPHLEPAGW
jgi:hypothetical protein